MTTPLSIMDVRGNAPLRRGLKLQPSAIESCERVGQRKCPVAKGFETWEQIPGLKLRARQRKCPVAKGFETPTSVQMKLQFSYVRGNAPLRRGLKPPGRQEVGPVPRVRGNAPLRRGLKPANWAQVTESSGNVRGNAPLRRGLKHAQAGCPLIKIGLSEEMPRCEGV